MKSSKEPTKPDVKDNTHKSTIQKSEKLALQDFLVPKEGSGA